MPMSLSQHHPHQHHQQYRPHDNHRVAATTCPPPPPPPRAAAVSSMTRTAAAPPLQSVSIVHNNIPASSNNTNYSNAPKAKVVNFQLQSPDFNNSRKDTTTTAVAAAAMNINALSPKLQSFFQGGAASHQTIRRNEKSISYPQTSTRMTTTTTSSSGRRADENEETIHNNNNNNNNNSMFSPTQQLLLDDSDDSSITLLHSIFSPKFHAQSAKKKKKKKEKRSNSSSSSNLYPEQRHHDQQQNIVPRGGGIHHHSIFSPVSTGSTTVAGRTNDNDDDDDEYANDSSAVLSEMSDEFSTIHAILRGETIESIKKLVGLDEANHPLHQSKWEGQQQQHDDAFGMVPSKSKVTSTNNNDAMSGYCDQNLDAKKSSSDIQKVQYNNPSIVDDSTEVMLDKARHLSNNVRNQCNSSTSTSSTFHLHDQNNIITSPTGNPQPMTTSQATVTPKVTPPMSDDEFYTPSTSDKPDRNQQQQHDDNNNMFPRLPGTSPSPIAALTFDVVIGNSDGIKRGLTPVREEEEGKVEEEYDVQARSEDWSDMKDFRTPKQQQGMDRQLLDDYDYGDNYNDDDDEEEFFSPLVNHPGHTPSNQQHGYYNPNQYMMNTVQSSLTALEFNNESLLDNNSYSQSSAMHPVAPTVNAPTTTEVPAKDGHTYSEMKQDLQSLLQEVMLLTPEPDKSRNVSISTPSNIPPCPTPVQASMYLGYSNDASSLQSPTSFHLHSPSLSNLPQNALTVDFVKACDCKRTLQTILGVLSGDNTCSMYRNNGKRGKQLRCPSLVRLVEKRLQKMMLKEQDDLSKLVNERSLQLPSDGADKENVDPVTLTNQKNRGSSCAVEETNAPVECLADLHGSNNASTKNDESMNHNGSPTLANESTSMSKSSLDMNLSASMFMLEDESFYWKQGADDDVKLEFERQDKDTQTHENDDIVVSNAQLATEMNHRAEELQRAEMTPPTNLEPVQSFQRRNANAAENPSFREQIITEFETINHTLRKEVQRLHQQIHHLNLTAENTTRKLQSELEEAMHQHSRLFQDNDKLERELYETRVMYEKAQREITRLKLLLEKQSESENAEKIQRVVESAKLANKALANALAVSEKDLADACAAKERSERECNALRDRSTKLEDKTSFLLSEVQKVTEELSSSHAYIDKLYAGLEASRIRSKEIMNEFQRRENEWIESKRGFVERIEDLESRIGSDSKHKVSMDAYLSVVKQTRHYKFESIKHQQTVNFLKDQLENARRSTTVTRDNKSTRVPTIIETSKQSVVNDENLVPSNSRMERVDQRSVKDDVTGLHHQQQEKQLNRIAVVRAAGGRKGLSEQLKRARRFGEKQSAQL